MPDQLNAGPGSGRGAAGLAARLDRAFEAVLTGFAVLSAVLVALIALGVTVNLVLRNAFGIALYGLLDGVEYALLAITFLAAPWVLSKGAHVTVDLVTAVLPPVPAAIAARVTAAVGLAVSGAFAWYAMFAALISWQRGSMIRSAFTFPEWWLLAIAPVAFAIIALEFLRQLLRPLRRGATTGL